MQLGDGHACATHLFGDYPRSFPRVHIDHSRFLVHDYALAAVLNGPSFAHECPRIAGSGVPRSQPRDIRRRQLFVDCAHTAQVRDGYAETARDGQKYTQAAQSCGLQGLLQGTTYMEIGQGKSLPQKHTLQPAACPDVDRKRGHGVLPGLRATKPAWSPWIERQWCDDLH